MPQWKTAGFVIRKYLNDHPPPHVHVFKDGKQIGRFDIEGWKVMDGKLPVGILRVLQKLRRDREI